MLGAHAQKRREMAAFGASSSITLCERDKDCYLPWLTKLLKEAENTWKGTCLCTMKNLQNFLSSPSGELLVLQAADDVQGPSGPVQGPSGRMCATQTPAELLPVNGL